MSDILHNSFLKTLLFYGVEWTRFTGNTADEMYNRLVLKVGDKPDKDAFLSKLTEFLVVARMEKLREERNKLLAESDWTQMPDVGVSNKEEWKTYRQVLRDLPSNVELTSDDFSNVFPEKPE
jgi:hypothetical protein